MEPVSRTSLTYSGQMPIITDLASSALTKARQYAERGSAELHYLQKMITSGAFGIEAPQNLVAMVADIRRWGEIGMIPALNARRAPNRLAIIDDEGSITNTELNDAVNAVANGLLAMGVRGGDGVGILARNHRWFSIANYACARVGARTIMLNTEFSGPQIRDVSEREGAKLIIYDDEYTEAVKLAQPALGKLRALASNPEKKKPSGSTDETLAELIARSSSDPAPKATKRSAMIILTSGTTGTPKGATRHTPPTLAPVGGILSSVPFKAGEITALPSPMFHAIGYLHAAIAATLGSTLILHRRFNAVTVLEDIAQRLPNVQLLVGLDLSERQTQINRSRDVDPRIRFETGDAMAWIPAYGEAGTVYLTVAGVFEYFPRQALQEMFAYMAAHQSPVAVALIEPIPADYDFENEDASRPYGFENSLGHNYLRLLRNLGFTTRFQEIQVVEGQTFLLLVAEKM